MYKFVAYLRNNKGGVDAQLWTQDFRHHGANATYEDRHIVQVIAIDPKHRFIRDMLSLQHLYPCTVPLTA